MSEVMHEGEEGPVPEVLERLDALMEKLGCEWALSGGWAVDSWLGRQTREHADVDPAIFEEDQFVLHRELHEGWLLNGHDLHDDDSTHPWDGHVLELPAHIHARAPGFELDFQLNRREEDLWIFTAEPRVIMPLASAIRRSPWGLPTLAPEAILYYKTRGDLRAHDEADFRLLLPTLDDEARTWLRDAVGISRPDHPWLPSLAPG